MTRGLDLAAGVVVIVLSLGMAMGAARFPTAAGAVTGPAVFPLLVAGLWCPLGIALLVSALRAKRAPPAAESTARAAWLFATTLAYAALMPVAGFVSASALYLVSGFALLGYRHVWRAGALGLSVAFLLFWIFGRVMKVPLPEGMLG